MATPSASEAHISHTDDELFITWTEKALGLTGHADARQSGFGTKLLDLTITSQLRGELHAHLDGRSYGCRVRSYPTSVAVFPTT